MSNSARKCSYLPKFTQKLTKGPVASILRKEKARSHKLAKIFKPIFKHKFEYKTKMKG